MMCYTTADITEDLRGILSLQKDNLRHVLDTDQIRNQGFVTVSHTFDQLRALNDIERHVVAKDGDKIVAYVLAMTGESVNVIPVLIPMFDQFGKIRYRDRMISDFNYIVVGQACVDRAYRGKGILDKCYRDFRDHFNKRYDFAVTEIACENTRSLAAHRRIGFQEAGRYTSPEGVEWSIVIWDWRAAR